MFKTKNMSTRASVFSAQFLPSAKNILLSGSSAGGIGAFEHANYLAKEFPAATVKATPIGETVNQKIFVFLSTLLACSSAAL